MPSRNSGLSPGGAKSDLNFCRPKLRIKSYMDILVYCLDALCLNEVVQLSSGSHRRYGTESYILEPV
ncbi:hypothetical protein WG66_016287 [Moniliophthora roreri]|nr:hypothetical protein WG66_016287 [Moniliophthora roreri]